MKLFIFTGTDHDYVFLVGVASVIVAKDRQQAKCLLDKALVAASLLPYKEEKYTLQEMSIDDPVAVVLLIGSY